MASDGIRSSGSSSRTSVARVPSSDALSTAETARSRNVCAKIVGTSRSTSWDSSWVTSETRTRRQTLADQVKATVNDVAVWRDEALLLNLAGFGPVEHVLLSQAGIAGLGDLLQLDLDDFRARVRRAATELKTATPDDLTMEGWWEQARTLEEA